MPLCSQADIEALRQIDFTNVPDETVAALIRHAEGILEGVTGRRFAPAADAVVSTNSYAQPDGILWLEIFPLTAVEILNSDGDPYTLNTHYVWSADGRIRRLGYGSASFTWAWEAWRTPEWPVGTTIKYSGGAADPNDVPQDLRTLCAEIAADLFDLGSSQGPAGVTQESLGAWSASYQRRAGNLSEQQQKIAARYRRNRGQLILT